MKQNKIKTCYRCNGKGTIELIKYFPVSRMKKLIKKHKLKQCEIAKLCNIKQASVSRWFHENNVHGIKEKHFVALASRGYK